MWVLGNANIEGPGSASGFYYRWGGWTFQDGSWHQDDNLGYYGTTNYLPPWEQ